MKQKQRLKIARDECIKAKVGDSIICPSCGTKHIKKAYNSVFCKSKGGSKCKDFYWNNVVPTKKKNLTRISPANARFQARVEDRRNSFFDPDDEHPFSSEALGQWD